jgi:Tol biopolymer transport system component
MVTPPSSDPSSFALSPDGRFLAFVASDEGRSRLWVRSFHQGIAWPLAGTDGASFPFWSPDSRSIGFFAESQLKRIPAAGGAALPLAEAPSGRGGTWNRDDIIVFARQTNLSGLMQVSAKGGTTPTLVTRFLPGHSSHRWPYFLPDGRRFLFSIVQGDASVSGIYVGSLDGGEPVRVTTEATSGVYAPPGYLLRVVNGALVAQPFDARRAKLTGDLAVIAQSIGEGKGIFRGLFSVSESGMLAHLGMGARRQLVWMGRDGRTLGTVGPPDELAPSGPQLSPDGRRIALIRAAPEGKTAIWLVDVAQSNRKQLTFDGGGGPIWSPTGDRVAFGTREGIFVKAANGTGEEKLLVEGNSSVVDWSPTGNVLLYAKMDPTTRSDLWAVPLDGEPRPIVQTRSDESQGQFSPDGAWLAFVSDETGLPEVYIQPFPSGEKWPVSTGGGIYPRWRRDGKDLYLYYVTPAPDSRLMEVPIEPGPDGALVPGRAVPLYTTRLATGGYILTTGAAARAQYAVAPDGRFLMNVAVDEGVLPITIVQNWIADLGRQGSAQK